MIKFSTFVKNKTNKSLEQLSDKETYIQLLNYVKTLSADKPKTQVNVRFTISQLSF